MSKPPVTATVSCSECGAQNLPGHDRCWLCYRPLIVTASLVPTTPKKPVPVARADAGSSILWAAAAVTLILVVLVGVGAFASDSGLGIAYCVIVSPALAIGAITFAVTQRRQQVQSAQSGGPVNQTTAVAAGLGSFFTSLAITAATLVVAAAVLVLVAAAAVIALIASCFAALGQGGM